MAYNVFKRPMFKRGGSTNGTGIMSHVEPKRVERVKAKTGFPFGNYSVGFPFEKSPYTLPPLNQNKTKLDYLPIPKIDIEFGPPKSELEQAVDIGGYGEIEPGPKVNYNNLPNWLLKAMGTEETRSILEKRKLQEDLNNDLGITAAFPKGTPTGTVYPGENIVKKETIETVETDTTPFKEEPKYVESDIRGDIEKEADLIKSLLEDKGLERAELAFLVADALKTPGSISDKLDTARKGGAKIVAGKRKLDREAMLLAYKSQKDKEIAQAKANQPTGTQKAVQEYANLIRKQEEGTITKDESARLKAYQAGVFKADAAETGPSSVIQLAAKDVFDKRNDIIDDISKVAELQAKEKRNQREEEKLAELLASLRANKRILELAGEDPRTLGLDAFKEGGRVMKQIGGTATEEPQIEAKETAGESNIFPNKPVEKLTYEQLRDRLPQEITNDIVQLLANSQDALQDFAYIRTQQDINDFNVKYGVNLILPPEQS